MTRSAPDIGVLYTRHGATVLRRVRRFYRDPEEAEEVLHEVFMRVMDKLDSFQGASSPVTWLYQVATRYCLNRLRNDRRRQELMDQNAGMLGWADPTDEANQEQKSILANLWRTLDPELLEIAVYYHIDGMTHDEIARILGVSRRVIGNRLVELTQRALTASNKAGEAS